MNYITYYFSHSRVPFTSNYNKRQIHMYVIILIGHFQYYIISH